MTYQESAKKIDYWLERLDLRQYKKYHIEELSKGNQQKIQFISAILHDPEILILDEPFSGFDPVNQTIFREVIEELKEDKYVILSTHLMDLAESLCDDIFLINEGKQILSGNLSLILNNHASSKYMIKYSGELSIGANEYLDQFKIISLSDHELVVELTGRDIISFIKDASNLIDIIEFVELKSNLHQIFLDNVES